jgi:hypothetical protein
MTELEGERRAKQEVERKLTEAQREAAEAALALSNLEEQQEAADQVSMACVHTQRMHTRTRTVCSGRVGGSGR